MGGGGVKRKYICQFTEATEFYFIENNPSDINFDPVTGSCKYVYLVLLTTDIR